MRFNLYGEEITIEDNIKTEIDIYRRFEDFAARTKHNYHILSILTSIIGLITGFKGIKSNKKGTTIAGIILNGIVFLFFMSAFTIGFFSAF